MVGLLPLMQGQTGEEAVSTPNILEDYLPCKCGADCSWLDAYADEPCYGQVDKDDEDDEGNPFHVCLGHKETLGWCLGHQTSRKYIPKL